jgi:predicted amidohydrolase
MTASPLCKVLRLAMAQMRVDPGQPEANLRNAVERIEQAAMARCDLVVLPECLDLGWGATQARHMAQPIPGPHVQRLADAAREHGIFVAAGLVERQGAQLFNAAVLLDDSGQQCLLHRKIHELGVVGGLYALGDRLGVAHTRLGVIGLAICADLAPESLAVGHVLARMGAQIIVAPSAWAVPPGQGQQASEPYGDLWLRSYGRLAALYELPVVGVSSVGRVGDGAWRGWPVIGASLALRADGSVAARGHYGEQADELIVCELALRNIVASGDALTDQLRERGHTDDSPLIPANHVPPA